MDEINQLVAEYNQVEAEQTARLEKLFQLIDKRKAYRRVAFSGGAPWVNCWGWEMRLALPRFVHVMERKITDVEPGSE